MCWDFSKRLHYFYFIEESEKEVWETFPNPQWKDWCFTPLHLGFQEVLPFSVSEMLPRRRLPTVRWQVWSFYDILLGKQTRQTRVEQNGMRWNGMEQNSKKAQDGLGRDRQLLKVPIRHFVPSLGCSVGKMGCLSSLWYLCYTGQDSLGCQRVTLSPHLPRELLC